MTDIIRNLPAVIYEYAIYPDGRRLFTYVSPSSERILGIHSEDVLRDPAVMDSLVYEEDREHFEQSSFDSQGSAREWNWQGRFLIDGKIKWVEIRSNHELQDEVVIRRGLIQDITERKESAREGELRYLALVERLPVGVVIHKNGRLLFANSQAHQILGAKKTRQLVGTDVLNFVHPDFHNRIIRRMKEVAEGLPGAMVEQKYVCMDGKVIDVETMAFPYTFQGEPCVQVIFRDITERKQSEARIKKNEILLAQLFQNLPMAVVMLNESGKVEQVNKGFEDMFGYSMADLKSKSINDFIVPAELHHEGIDLNNLITSNRVVSVETIRRHRNGNIVNVILYGVPVMQDNQTIGIYGVYVNITDRKRVEEELKVRNAELDNFVYKVSHDLRAPLSSILGLVNLARLPGNTDNPMDYIDIIGEKVEHLDHFISDVLSHSKNLKMEVSTSRVDLQKIIDSTFSDLSYLEGAKAIKRHVKIEGLDMYSDPWRISEIFRNLISNSIKYRRLDAGDPEISIKIRVDNVKAEIDFSDNGIGIDEKNLQKIFEMFYRATEQSDGSGIGLYIVKNAIDKLGGQISVASRPLEGARFSIILPNRINATIPRNVPFEIEQQ
jgi:PAS domain S-box-containing protein